MTTNPKCTTLNCNQTTRTGKCWQCRQGRTKHLMSSDDYSERTTLPKSWGIHILNGESGQPFAPVIKDVPLICDGCKNSMLPYLVREVGNIRMHDECWEKVFRMMIRLAFPESVPPSPVLSASEEVVDEDFSLFEDDSK